MKFPTPWFLTASILAFGAAGPLAAQQPALHSTPAVKDLTPPTNTTGEATPSPGQMMQPELKLVAQFDRDGDHRLDANERQAARAWLAQHPPPDATPPPGRPREVAQQSVALEPVKPGKKLSPADVPGFADQPLFDPRILRTVFLEFSDTDWEKELADFAPTDVLVPAHLTVDGRTYAGVGVRFRAQPAAPSRGEGYKRTLDLTLDFADAGQQLEGRRQLRLLDVGTDPTFLRTMLYARVARAYVPAPRTNFVRVVINGENWGVYINTELLDENFLQKNFGSTQGARWTVYPGGSLAYLGDNPAAYRNSYRLESPDDPAAWAELIQLCKILDRTATDDLESALAPHLDIDGTLRFLALENALLNQDGYSSRAGGYGLYLDAAGHFHFVPLDAEASFRLLQVTEYDKHSRGTGSRRGGGDRGGSSGKEKANESAPGVARGYNPNDFPHQSGTDLAMLLSNSFINKADVDFNGAVTRDEWLTFARSWFLVMDEDHAGELTRDQFITKFRDLVTPPSIVDGHSKQTFGHDDVAAVIGQDFFAAMDENHDGRLTRDELTGAFARWFAAWSNPKSARLTQDGLQRGFASFFSQSVFQADQAYIRTKTNLSQAGEERGGGGSGRGERGNRGGGEGGGSGMSLGPLRLGLGGRGGREGDSRTLVTFSEQLEPLAGLEEMTKPLLTKLLLVPALRTRYLDDLREITETWLTWSKLGPVAKEYHELIAAEVGRDTHKAASYTHFVQELDQDTAQGPRDGDEAPSLKSFITERNAYLLKGDTLDGRIGGW